MHIVSFTPEIHSQEPNSVLIRHRKEEHASNFQIIKRDETESKQGMNVSFLI